MKVIQICEFPNEPVTSDTRQDKKSIQLLNTFLRGPSSKKCKIEFVDADSENDPSQSEDSQSSQDQSHPSSDQKADSESSSSDNNGFVRKNYSVLEALSLLNRVFEAESSGRKSSLQEVTEKSRKNKSSRRNKPSSKNKLSGQNQITQQADSANDQKDKASSSQVVTAQSGQNQITQQTDRIDDQKDQKFTNDAKTTLHVKVSLLNEGYSIWTILLDSKVTNIDSVKSAIKSGKFGAARKLAITNTNPACFIVSQVKTFVSMDNNFTSYAPFIGRCRYAMDSGTDKDSSEDNTVCIAIAPIDGCTEKPSEKIVFKVLYNIVDINKLTSGAVKSISDKASNKDGSSEDDYRYSRGSDDKNQTALSVWINKKFNNEGDSEEYGNFLKLRKFVADNINAKNLEYDETNSENLKDYSLLSAVKQAIIAY